MLQFPDPGSETFSAGLWMWKQTLTGDWWCSSGLTGDGCDGCDGVDMMFMWLHLEIFRLQIICGTAGVSSIPPGSYVSCDDVHVVASGAAETWNVIQEVQLKYKIIEFAATKTLNTTLCYLSSVISFFAASFASKTLENSVHTAKSSARNVPLLVFDWPMQRIARWQMTDFYLEGDQKPSCRIFTVSIGAQVHTVCSGVTSLRYSSSCSCIYSLSGDDKCRWWIWGSRVTDWIDEREHDVNHVLEPSVSRIPTRLNICGRFICDDCPPPSSNCERANMFLERRRSSPELLPLEGQNWNLMDGPNAVVLYCYDAKWNQVTDWPPSSDYEE